MWLYFDKNGTLIKSLEHGNSARAGSTDFQIFAVFEGDDFPSAYIKLFKPDYNHEAYPALPMKVSKSLTFVKDVNEGDTYPFVNGTTYTGYYFDFAHDVNSGLRSTILLDTAGLWSASIELHSAGSVHNVVGQATFNVGFGFEDEDENEITADEYVQELIALMDTKMNIKATDEINVIRLVENISTHGEFREDIYTVGDIVFDKETHKLYKLTGLGEDDYEVVDMPYVKKSGDTMTGDLNMSGHKITGLADAEDDGDAVSKKYLEEHAAVNGKNILVFDNKSDIVISKYEEGQLFFVRNDKIIYKLVGSDLTVSFCGVLTYSSLPNAADFEIGQVVLNLNDTTNKLYEVDNTHNWHEIFNFKSVITTEVLEDYVTQEEKEGLIDRITGIEETANAALPKDDVINDLEQIAGGKALDARQGKILSDRIKSLEGFGRYLSVWNATTGKPNDLPGEVDELTEEYEFKTGDYYKVGTGGYRVPIGKTLPVGTTIDNFPYETGTIELKANDTILFNGTGWEILHTPELIATFDSIAGNPYDNNNLKVALNHKQNQVKVMNTIPTTDDLEENEIAVVPSIRNFDSDTIIGDGLSLTTDVQGQNTLQISKKFYLHTVFVPKQFIQASFHASFTVKIISDSATPITTYQNLFNAIAENIHSSLKGKFWSGDNEDDEVEIDAIFDIGYFYTGEASVPKLYVNGDNFHTGDFNAIITIQDTVSGYNF